MHTNISLSIVIPFYNEEQRLPQTLKSLNELLKYNFFPDLEIIFVNDGSDDRGVDMVEKFNYPFKVKLVSYELNKGKGHAVKQGMLASSKDYSLISDADMSTPLSEIAKMLPSMQEGAPVIIGTRKGQKCLVVKHQPWYRKKMGQVFTFLARLILQVNVSDFTCGFKCFSRSAVQKIFNQSQINRWGYDAEILFLAKKFKLNIKEIPVIWNNNEATRVKLLKDVPRSFLELMKIRYLHGK